MDSDRQCGNVERLLSIPDFGWGPVNVCNWHTTACGGWRRKGAIHRFAHFFHRPLSAKFGNRGCMLGKVVRATVNDRLIDGELQSVHGSPRIETTYLTRGAQNN